MAACSGIPRANPPAVFMKVVAPGVGRHRTLAGLAVRAPAVRRLAGPAAAMPLETRHVTVDKRGQSVVVWPASITSISIMAIIAAIHPGGAL